MDSPTPSMRDLVRRLMAASHAATGPRGNDAVRVFETLRVHLTRLAGADGFTSLLRRALTLAKAEVPALGNVKLAPDGHLQGIEELAPEAAIALAAHLVGLLETFIGKPLTVRLVREAWPEISLDE